MKKFASVVISLLFCLSSTVFAAEHAESALEHANGAVTHGRAGHPEVLVEHAKLALEQTLAAALNSKGVTKTHLDAAADSLQKAIDEGSLDHTQTATKYVEEAVSHLQAAGKK